MRVVSAIQSCYVPWRGYFDFLGSSDIFIVYDDAQYSKNHWHNRNYIKMPDGKKWMTIPVSKKMGSFIPIDEVEIAKPFAQSHLSMIRQAYGSAPEAGTMMPLVERWYEEANSFTTLSEVNVHFMKRIAGFLGFSPEYVHSRSLGLSGAKTDRLLQALIKVGATDYISGPSASSYLEEEKFQEAGIRLHYMDYSGYPAYPQQFGNFDPQVSTLDLLFNVGDRSVDFMKSSAPPRA